MDEDKKAKRNGTILGLLLSLALYAILDLFTHIYYGRVWF